MRNWNSRSKRSFYTKWSIVFRLPMRNWNSIYIFFPYFLYRVFRLPMRNWNLLKPACCMGFGAPFLDYLWGIETRIFWWWKSKTVCVFRLPMRNWNMKCTRKVCQMKLVFRLPMRNWNKFQWRVNQICSDVFRLPMRNWNPLQQTKKSIRTLFLDYLWGIETQEALMFDGEVLEFLDYLWGIETIYRTH